MSENTNSDTLVLKLEEKQNGKKELLMYVLHDWYKGCYILRGTRMETSYMKYHDFSFECHSANELADFIECLVDTKHSMICYTLSNYINLPLCSNDITLDLLIENDVLSRELVRDDNCPFHKKECIKKLKIIRCIFNEYGNV